MNTDKKLKNFIDECVRKTLKEGHTSNLAYERWEELKEMVGCERMVDDIYNFLNSDQIDQLIEWFNEDYELWDDDAEDEEYEDEEDFFESRAYDKLICKINETVKRKINEANGQTPWRGVPESVFLWHGEWSDPEIWYKDQLINANDAEELLWDRYKDHCEETGEEPSEQGFDEWVDIEEAECALIDCMM